VEETKARLALGGGYNYPIHSQEKAMQNDVQGFVNQNINEIASSVRSGGTADHLNNNIDQESQDWEKLN
jgi:hypothetical protein